MSRQLTSARRVARSLRKLYAGMPQTPSGPLAGTRNVAGALSFLVGRKLGLGLRPSLSIAHRGVVHLWPLIERSDLSVIEEIFLDGEYELDIPAPRTILDLGANFGAASVYFAQRWPEARIVSVEPSPSTFPRLKEMTAPYPNITCLNIAVGGSDGTAQFVVSQDHIGSSLFRQDPNGAKVEVVTQTLPTLMRELALERVDLVKFDVEGAEEDLFRDASVLPRIGTLVGEVHKDLMRMPVAEFLSLFDAFDVAKRTENGDMFVMTAVRRAG